MEIIKGLILNPMVWLIIITLGLLFWELYGDNKEL